MSVMVVLYIGEEDPVVHLEARFAMLQIMGPNEKEHAERGIMPHE